MIIIQVLIHLFLHFASGISYDVCETDACYKEARKISSKIDFSADPCEDFYSFICGNYFEKYNISSRYHVFNEMYVMNVDLYSKLFEVLGNDKNYSEPLMLSKKFFKGCIQVESLKRDIEPLSMLVDEIGGWPVVMENIYDESMFTWEDIVYEAFKRGLFYDFPVEISTIRLNSANATHFRQIIKISRPAVPLSFVQYQENSNYLLEIYKQYHVEIAQQFGAESINAKTEFQEVLDFEMCLANISALDVIFEEDKRYHVSTLFKLQENYSAIDWGKIFRAALPDDVEISDFEIISFSSHEYLSALNELFEMTPKRTIINFFIWRIVDAYLKYLTGRHSIYRNNVALTEEYCLNLALNALPVSTNALYLREFYRPKTKELTTVMMNSIKHEFAEIVKLSTWMDSETKELALKKVESMQQTISYPHELIDDDTLKAYYQNISLNENEFFEAMLAVNKFSQQEDFKNLHEYVSKTRWEDRSLIAIINAFYVPYDNNIIIPAAFLSNDFVNEDRPQYLNIASLGHILGHELTHGFDSIGHRLDANGNVVDWWNYATKKTFTGKFRCMIKEYNTFVDSSSQTYGNGFITLSENIADNGGAKLSYRYFQKHIQSSTEKILLLPNLNFTLNQLFWVVQGQTWCEIHDSFLAKQMANYAHHSLPQFRVNGPFRNMKEFARDWSCEQDTFMNPKEKCEVW